MSGKIRANGAAVAAALLLEKIGREGAAAYRGSAEPKSSVIAAQCRSSAAAS